MAGKGFLPRECIDSIMQFDKFRARSDVSDARLSGISVKRFADRSNDCKVLANGAKLEAEILVNALSARLRCLRNLHLDDGKNPNERRFDVLFRGVLDRTLDPELPEDRRMLGVLLLPYT
jgi:hypothetical protein